MSISEISQKMISAGGGFKGGKDLEVAKNLEIAFISEMLSFVGATEVSESFGGGVGEEQFQSFLRDEHAKLIAEKGGLGLAEHFLNNFEEK